jgi:septal ring factor EnvC (AmiA/AmiB activator)
MAKSAEAHLAAIPHNHHAVQQIHSVLGRSLHSCMQVLAITSCLQTERDGLSKRLAAASKKLAESNSKAACASLESQSVNKEQRRLQAEVERLSSVVHSHSVRLQKCVQLPAQGPAH